MSYVITQYTKQRAKELNVIVKQSTNKNKKIDVFAAPSPHLLLPSPSSHSFSS